MRAVLLQGFCTNYTQGPLCYSTLVRTRSWLPGTTEATLEKPWGASWPFLFFEAAGGGLVKRVNPEALGAHQKRITFAELTQTMGLLGLLEDRERTAATTELRLEAHLHNLELMRMLCVVEPCIPEDPT